MSIAGTSEEYRQQQIRKYSAAQELVGIRRANELLSLLSMSNIEEKENENMNINVLGKRKDLDSIGMVNCHPVFFNDWEEIILKNRKSIVTDVNVIVPNKVVEVTFADGSKQKTVCSENDEFSLELAISICITKNLIGGTSNYNKAVNNGIKVYEKKLQKQEEYRKEEERVKAKRIKLAAKQAERITRKKEEEMERQIEIQKEAIIRAHRDPLCSCVHLL